MTYPVSLHPASHRRAGLTHAAAALLSCAMLWPHASAAEGSLAVGLPDDVAKQGVAIGHAVNFPTRAEAEANAMKECAEFQGAPPATRKLCKVIQSFSGQCVSVALDPEDGTPGVGWAVASTGEAAESAAMARCLATAGENRRQFCKVEVTRCDRPR